MLIRKSWMILLPAMLLFCGNIFAQDLLLIDKNNGDKLVTGGTILIDTSDLTALELNAHLKIQNNTSKPLAIFMKKIINQMVDSTSNYFCLNPKCWPDADSTDIADTIPAGLGDSSFVTHYDHYFRYERSIPPGFTSITYLFYDHTTFTYPVEAWVTINYHVSGVGLPETEKPSMNVWPNPATDVLYVSESTAGKFHEAAIFDLRGKRILSRTLGNTSGNLPIDISSLANGIYFLHFIGTNGEIKAEKFIVNR